VTRSARQRRGRHVANRDAVSESSPSGRAAQAAWSVTAKGTQIAKGASIPWPNDPRKPSIGICGRGNPYVLKAIPIKNGRFSFTGKVRGLSVTWTGQWTSPRKMRGTVKWAGCKTLVTYKATV
jgi:hypothetical protein